MAQSLRVAISEKDPVKVNAALNQVAQKIDVMLGGSIDNNPMIDHGLNLQQSPSFSSSSTYICNHIVITDKIHQSDATHPINGLTVDINTGAFGGARQAITGNVTTGGTMDVATKDAFLVGGAFGAFANVSTGGTDTIANARGSFCGVNPVVSIADNVTNVKGIKGIEVDISSGAGSTFGNRVGIDIVLATSKVGGDLANGGVDRALQFTAENGATTGWNEGIVWDSSFGVPPMRTTGTLIKTVGSQTIDKGIDISSATITTAAFKSPNFSVDGTGFISGSALLVTSTISAATPQTFSSTTPTLVGTGAVGAIFTAGSAVTLTLPSPAGNSGRWLWLKTITSSVASASSNVVPLTSTTAGTAILSGGGKWALLQSDATNWIIMTAN